MVVSVIFEMNEDNENLDNQEVVLTGKRRIYNRRDFFSKSAYGAASIALLGISKKETSFDKKKSVEQNTRKKVIYRTLGKTGLKMPIVNMGVMNAFYPALVKRSYEIGIRHFDTAANYQRGQNEIMVGNVIKELGVRDKVIIGTKVDIPDEQRDMHPEQAKEIFLNTAADSLKRLQTDYIDILYVHSVKNIKYLNNPGIHEALQSLKEQKKSRFIGFTTHTNMTECINEAARTGFYDVILTTFNYSLVGDKRFHDSIKKAVSKGIGIIAMKTQCTQYFYRQDLPSELQQYYKGKITHTAVLKWVLRNDSITTAVPGYSTFQQMEEDFSVAYNLGYTLEEKKFLEDRNVKLLLAYCHQCNQCVSTCPRGVDIPTLMRTHMYATCYSNFYQARDALNSIPKGKNLQACTSCETCTASCFNRIDIQERINELKTIYA